MLRDGPSQAIGNDQRFVRPYSGQHNRKLFSAGANHKIVWPRTRPEYVGNATQDHVAGHVPEGIVVRLEMIDVERQDRIRDIPSR